MPANYQQMRYYHLKGKGILAKISSSTEEDDEELVAALPQVDLLFIQAGAIHKHLSYSCHRYRSEMNLSSM